MVRRGLSELVALWNTYWMERHSSFGRSRAVAGSDAPRNRTSPERGACRPMIARASVVFPEPDSPTSARHSRSWSWSETSSSTCRAPWNALRPVTSSSAASAAGAARPGSAATTEGPSSPTRMQRALWPGATATAGGGASSQAGIAAGQRGANTQPEGRAPGGGTRPGIASSSRRAAMSGIAPISLRVYGCAGSAKSAFTGPSSTMRPAYMTSTRWARAATTARSWLTYSAAVS